MVHSGHFFSSSFNNFGMKHGFDKVAFWVIQCKCCPWWVFFRILLEMLFFSSWHIFEVFFLKNTFLFYHWELDIAHTTQKQSQPELHNETPCHKTAIGTFTLICTSWKFSAKKLMKYRMYLFLSALWEKALISGSLYKKLFLPERWEKYPTVLSTWFRMNGFIFDSFNSNIYPQMRRIEFVRALSCHFEVFCYLCFHTFGVGLLFFPLCSHSNFFREVIFH